ncbi:calcium/calmodulin-regulated receptor-like kinase 2 isoform X1 [Ananas comosus]|uniref:Calcium/calmodulin-regulated receptor-like kinase 2 isoform X1 n=1 Tax=Ananas comosus TaxID=4615 RepID=A0A6P5F2E1_ANACO|nr:calcium/calmodulin-regulated receptor-like kinase 2 isoform X1 [Ananas comosus]
MGSQANITIIGVTVGAVAVILIAVAVFVLIRIYKNWSRKEPSISSLPIRTNGANATSIDSSVSISVSESAHDLQTTATRNTYWGRRGQHNNDLHTSASGIPRYSYKDIQKATKNFTTILGQGSFGPVYKAVMPTGGVVAVKVLASDSKQGEREFHTEVVLLSRLHHRNLVNLVGYCVDKNQRMLVYEFMSNGSLASLLYGDNPRVLSWEERLQIAHDVSHGIEYLHEGAVPPIIHRDLKSANILLDGSLRAKVADFGLSKEEVFDERKSGLKGTYGYMDPDYMSTNKFTKKSDVYSFGIILFELITTINPQQGLMEYINLAATGGDGKANWDEIIDTNLIGESNPDEVGHLANIAHRCLHKIPKRRPSISDVTQAISRIRQRRLMKEDTLPSSRIETSGVLRRIELQQLELNNITSMRGWLLRYSSELY